MRTTKNGYFKIRFTVDSTTNVDDNNWGWNVTVYDKNLIEVLLRMEHIRRLRLLEKALQLNIQTRNL